MIEEYHSTKNIVYNYDSINGEYISASLANIDPLESQLNGYEIFLRPSNSTFIEPPKTKENEKVIFENGEWKIKTIENKIIYYNQEVKNKKDVDWITSKLIKDLGEEKAKTEKLIAGSEPCDFWNEFIEKRITLIQKGNDFVAKYDLK